VWTRVDLSGAARGRQRAWPPESAQSLATT
jgi:hypothetical protein